MHLLFSHLWFEGASLDEMSLLYSNSQHFSTFKRRVWFFCLALHTQSHLFSILQNKLYYIFKLYKILTMNVQFKIKPLKYIKPPFNSSIILLFVCILLDVHCFISHYFLCNTRALSSFGFYTGKPFPIQNLWFLFIFQYISLEHLRKEFLDPESQLGLTKIPLHCIF